MSCPFGRVTLQSVTNGTLNDWCDRAFACLIVQSQISTRQKSNYKRHLIQRVEEREGGYKIHPLIREFLQAKLAASDQAKEFKRTFAQGMVAIAKEIPDLDALTVTDIVTEGFTPAA